jgi:hypothetical protein
VLPGETRDDWFIVREKGDVSFIALLEHEWIRNFNSEMVLVRHVLGVGREADKMAAEVYPGIIELIALARGAFYHKYMTLSVGEALRGIHGFYHFGKGGFCLHPWDEIERVAIES